MTNAEDVRTAFHTARKPRAIGARRLAFYARHASNNGDRPELWAMRGDVRMFFNDDSMLDFRGNGFGENVMDAIFGGPVGFDAGEVVITGRVPGALYLDDIDPAQYGLEHIRPLEHIQNELSAIGAIEVADLGNDADSASAAASEESAGGALVAANDDDAPAALSLPSHGKDAEPLALIPGDGDGDESLVQLDLDALHDLAIPPLPGTVDLSMVTVTPPNSVEAEPVIIGGPAYQSLSFLILDTPFVVGDDHLPPTVRPSIEELLGLAGDDTWVLPLGSTGAWRLG